MTGRADLYSANATSHEAAPLRRSSVKGTAGVR
jgi:hypothetical protein